MAKTSNLRITPLEGLKKRKADLLLRLAVPRNLVRASFVSQFLACGKANCHCSQGFKHGPYFYLVQCLGTGKVRKFLLKTGGQQTEARESIEANKKFQERLAELSEINTELLRRGAW